MAVLDPGLAGRHAGHAPLLSDLGHGDRKDILFFWVARMMMLGLFLTDVDPSIPSTSTAWCGHRAASDEQDQGQRDRSVELIDEIGADALRLR